MFDDPFMLDLLLRGDSDPLFSNFVTHVPSTGDRVCIEGTDYRVDEMEWLFLRGKQSGAIAYLKPLTGFGE